jgi:hypothetical protein
MHQCAVPELYWKGRDVDTINFDKLPGHYVIRPTIGHSCNLVFLMKGGLNLLDKRTYTQKQILEVLKDALGKNQHLEFLLEEFVRTEKGQYKIPDDYKFYMFDGKIALIEIINRLGPSEGSFACYDEDWNLIPNIANSKYKTAAYQAPPACLSTMIEWAKKLSKAYQIFVRVDFYATDKGAVFGEFTATPGSAYYLTAVADNMLTRHWTEYCGGKI